MDERQKIEKVLDLVESGCPLKKSLKIAGLARATFNRALTSVREFNERYHLAKELNADILVDEALAIADSNIDPQVARNRIQIRQWIASKHKPKTYGERIDVNLARQVSIVDAQAEARARLLNAPLPVLDAEIVPKATPTLEDKVKSISDLL